MKTRKVMLELMVIVALIGLVSNPGVTKIVRDFDLSKPSLDPADFPPALEFDKPEPVISEPEPVPEPDKFISTLSFTDVVKEKPAIGGHIDRVILRVKELAEKSVEVEPAFSKSAETLVKAAERLVDSSKTDEELAKAADAFIRAAEDLAKKSADVDLILLQEAESLVKSSRHSANMAKTFSRLGIRGREQFLLSISPAPSADAVDGSAKRKPVKQISKTEYEELKKTRQKRSLEYQKQKLRKEQESLREDLKSFKEGIEREKEKDDFRQLFVKLLMEKRNKEKKDAAFSEKENFPPPEVFRTEQRYLSVFVSRKPRDGEIEVFFLESPKEFETEDFHQCIDFLKKKYASEKAYFGKLIKISFYFYPEVRAVIPSGIKLMEEETKRAASRLSEIEKQLVPP